MNNGMSFSLSKQAVSQGQLSTQLILPDGVSLLVVRLTVAATDPQAQATVGVTIEYTDYTGVNPPPATQTLSLANASNQVNLVLPVTPTNGVVALSFPVTGTAGSYNALVVFK